MLAGRQSVNRVEYQYCAEAPVEISKEVHFCDLFYQDPQLQTQRAWTGTPGVEASDLVPTTLSSSRYLL